MARGTPECPDVGPYGPGLVRIILHSENLIERKQYERSLEIRQKISDALTGRTQSQKTKKRKSKAGQKAWAEGKYDNRENSQQLKEIWAQKRLQGKFSKVGRKCLTRKGKIYWRVNILR